MKKAVVFVLVAMLLFSAFAGVVLRASRPLRAQFGIGASNPLKPKADKKISTFLKPTKVKQSLKVQAVATAAKPMMYEPDSETTKALKTMSDEPCDTCPCQAHMGKEVRTITVKALGEFRAAPDTAYINLAVNSKDAEVAQAQRKNAEAVAAAVSAISAITTQQKTDTENYAAHKSYELDQATENGAATLKRIDAVNRDANKNYEIKGTEEGDDASVQTYIGSDKKTNAPQDDIAIMNYNVYADYDYSGGVSTQKGYVASTFLRIRVSNFGLIGDILDAAGKSGINNISGIEFFVDDISSARSEALKGALESAQNKAKLIAQSVGMTLGTPLSIKETDQYDNNISHYAIRTTDSAAINPDKLTVKAGIEIVYCII